MAWLGLVWGGGGAWGRWGVGAGTAWLRFQESTPSAHSSTIFCRRHPTLVCTPSSTLLLTTIFTVYNEAAKNAGLSSRMCKFVPEKRGQAPPKKMRIYHSKGDKDDWRSGLAAAPSITSASSSSKRPQSHQEEDQEGKRHRESARSSHQTEPPAGQWDWDWNWQSWNWQSYGQGTQPWPRQYR